MKKLVVVLAIVGLIAAASIPAMTDEGGAAFVHVTHAHDDVWAFSFQHYNPCTGNWPEVQWEAEHRNMLVDRDGDLSTIDDRMKNPRVMNILWATHPEDDRVVKYVGDSLDQTGWDEQVRFDADGLIPAPHEEHSAHVRQRCTAACSICRSPRVLR